MPEQRSLTDLRAYLDWLERWADGSTEEPPPTERARPTLRLIPGGDDA